MIGDIEEILNLVFDLLLIAFFRLLNQQLLNQKVKQGRKSRRLLFFSSAFLLVFLYTGFYKYFSPKSSEEYISSFIWILVGYVGINLLDSICKIRTDIYNKAIMSVLSIGFLIGLRITPYALVITSNWIMKLIMTSIGLILAIGLGLVLAKLYGERIKLI